MNLGHFFGSRDPKEELFGDAFELALGFLTLAHRFNRYFPNWPDAKTIRACISGLEKSFYRYAAGGRGTNRRRNPPKKSHEADRYISDHIAHDLLDYYDVAPMAKVSYSEPEIATQGVESAPPASDGRRGPRDQPQQEVEATTTDVDIPSDADIGIMANTFLNALSTLDNGDTHAQEEERDRSCFHVGAHTTGMVRSMIGTAVSMPRDRKPTISFRVPSSTTLISGGSSAA